MCKSLQFVICTSTCKLDPQKLETCDKFNLLFSSEFSLRMSTESQFSNNLLQCKIGWWPKTQTVKLDFQIKTFKKLPRTLFKCFSIFGLLD